MSIRDRLRRLLRRPAAAAPVSPPPRVAVPRDPVQVVLDYHHTTMHHPHRYARGPGFMDWESQPDPFRRFDGAPLHDLPLRDIADV